MSKRDNANLVLMAYCKVNLQCDDKKLQLRYQVNPDNPTSHVWFCNGKNTGLQVLDLIKKLKEKYSNIKVLWKCRF